ncbi:MAG: response regulator transcription factor [Opitutaceae bacterium]|nr:response regulator transcription factor [Opitutaceae bacterium]
MKFNGKILIVDDEAHIRKFVTLILRQLGCSFFVEAGNGQDALAVYQAEQPDLVLMDVNMPQMDGIEALRQLRTIDPEAIVVMLTSLVNRDTIEKALEFGAVNYIRKDTPKDEIAQALSETIESCFGEAEETINP